MITRITAIALLMLVILVGCSRKPDNNLPERIGDLRVRVLVVEDQAGLPGVFPVTVAVYDTSHTRLIRSQTISTDTGTVQMVEFKDMASAFFNVRFTVNVDSLGTPSCAEDMSVFVRLNEVTTTPVRQMMIHYGRADCTELNMP